MSALLTVQTFLITTAIRHILHNTFPPYLKLHSCWLTRHEENLTIALQSQNTFQEVFMIILNDIEAMCLAAVDIL